MSIRAPAGAARGCRPAVLCAASRGRRAPVRSRFTPAQPLPRSRKSVFVAHGFAVPRRATRDVGFDPPNPRTPTPPDRV
jgi:hypothetical protein